MGRLITAGTGSVLQLHNTDLAGAFVYVRDTCLPLASGLHTMVCISCLTAADWRQRGPLLSGSGLLPAVPALQWAEVPRVRAHVCLPLPDDGAGGTQHPAVGTGFCAGRAGNERECSWPFTDVCVEFDGSQVVHHLPVLQGEEGGSAALACHDSLPPGAPSQGKQGSSSVYGLTPGAFLLFVSLRCCMSR